MSENLDLVFESARLRHLLLNLGSLYVTDTRMTITINGREIFAPILVSREKGGDERRQAEINALNALIAQITEE